MINTYIRYSDNWYTLFKKYWYKAAKQDTNKSDDYYINIEQVVLEFDDVNTISNNARHNISEYEILEKTHEAADKYIKSIETAIQLLKQNKNNQQFIEGFRKVGSSLIKEIDTCQEVLNQHTQQKT
ncbi:15600_t:CDS:2 [Gigaspora margarita]|uniref:15600_t:CDS:1 n=1 Tax=Gigaspora margarita TaxID=4874 RepID=A0ABN7UNP5_GIGMA|nr:15600_t:CDS:2 [Gigaspora margarita]